MGKTVGVGPTGAATKGKKKSNVRETTHSFKKLPSMLKVKVIVILRGREWLEGSQEGFWGAGCMKFTELHVYDMCTLFM